MNRRIFKKLNKIARQMLGEKEWNWVSTYAGPYAEPETWRGADKFPLRERYKVGKETWSEVHADVHSYRCSYEYDEWDWTFAIECLEQYVTSAFENYVQTPSGIDMQYTGPKFKRMVEIIRWVRKNSLPAGYNIHGRF